MKKDSLFKTAGLIALITILSKIFGFLRDVMIAKHYGATVVSDAYFYAYQLPSLALIIMGGLGGPFHTATVAIFSKLASSDDENAFEYAQKVFNTFLTITGILFAIFSIAIFFFAHDIISIVAAGATPKLQQLATMQLKIMSPVVFIGGIIGIFYGISNVYREFMMTSFSPTVASLATIAGLMLLSSSDSSGIILSWTTLIGAVGQLAIQFPAFLKTRYKFKPSIDYKDKNVSRLIEILFPAMIATTIGQMNIYIDMFFTSKLQEGAWSAIGYSNRLFQFPVGIIMTAMLVPLFPMFSEFVGKKDFASLKKYYHQGVNSLWFLCFPILGFIFLFSQNLISLVFERGSFDHNATVMVSQALVFLSLSMIPYVARDTLTRVYYAFDDSKTPFVVAMVSIVVKTLMNILLISVLGLGIPGITLSTTTVTWVNFILLSNFMKKKTDLKFWDLTQPTIKLIIATTAMMGAGFASKIFLGHYFDTTNTMKMAGIGVHFVICATVYLVACVLLKVHAMTVCVERLKNKFFKTSTPEEVVLISE